MINETFYSHDMKCVVRQISKRTARKLWDAGEEIFLHPSSMRFDNFWQHPMPAMKGRGNVGQTFDYLCHDFAWYNCDSERGKYIHFYVKETK